MPSPFEHYITCCTEKTFRLLFPVSCCDTGTYVRVLKQSDVFLNMFMCPYPRYRYRHPGGRRTAVPTDARGAQQEQVVGIQDLGFGDGESRAAGTNWRRAVGRNWCRRSLRGMRWRVHPRAPHAPCMARMSRVHGQGGLWAQHPGLQVGSPTRGAPSNLGSQHASRCNEFGHLKGGRQCTRSVSQHLRDPREERTPRVAARRCTLDFFKPSPCLARRQWRWGDAAIAHFLVFWLFSRPPQGGEACDECTMRAMDPN